MIETALILGLELRDEAKRLGLAARPECLSKATRAYTTPENQLVDFFLC